MARTVIQYKNNHENLYSHLISYYFKNERKSIHVRNQTMQ